MINREAVMALLEMGGDDVCVSVSANGIHIWATVVDHIGFDEDWNEISRELDDPELVEFIENQLARSANSVWGDLYRHFEFDGFVVIWGYSSFDI